MEIVSNKTEQINCLMLTFGQPLTFWDQIDLVFYNGIPFLIMVTFNSLLIINLRKKMCKPIDPRGGQTPSKYENHMHEIFMRKRRSLTVWFICLSFLFVAMTTPGTVVFSFFYSEISVNLDQPLVFLLDDISFAYHALLFPISFFSNKKFRKAVISVFCGDEAKKQ